jgi:CSLREA domain-containing protein
MNGRRTPRPADRWRVPLQLGAVVGCLVLPGVAWATTYTVTSTADAVDANPGNNVCATAGAVCTLRAAVQEANAHNGADAISIPAGTFTLSLAGAGEDSAATGDLDLLDPVTITGAGATSTIISANRIDRVFDIFVGASPASITNLTVSDGFSGVGILAGGIWNSATLTLNAVRILNSEGRLGGGGILNENALTATDVTISGCTTNSQGAGLYNTATATLTGVTLSGNISAAGGGGIKNDDTLTLTNVTLSGNTAGTDGGGLCDIDVALATLKNVTVTNNSANRGWGLFSSGEVTATNVIVADSTSGENCGGLGSRTSGGGNLDTTTSGTTCGFSGTGDLVGVTALLGALGDNGGPTQTHLLLSGSPAIDAGQSCPPPATDQRGMTRPLDGDDDTVAVCDIGAVEVTAAATSSTSTVPGTSTTSTTLAGGLVPGGPVSKRASDCYLELLMAGIQAEDIEGNRAVLCIDGDPCDLGPCGDGVCALRAALCVNQLDANLADCTPPAGGLVKVRVRNAIQLEPPAAITAPACSPWVDFNIETRFNKAGNYVARKSRQKLKGKAVAVKGIKPRSDVDTWIVQCMPRQTACPALLP